MPTLYNTLSRKTDAFKPLKENEARLYTCGPTVYDFAHVGNLRTYIFEDLLRRVLEYDGYKVNHGMNITDVGHLVGDSDFAEDKIDIAAAREGKNPLDIAKIYEAQFFKDCEKLKILKPHTVLRATDTIADQIAIIEELEAKGFIYSDEYAVYFDTSKLSDYGKLSGQKLEDKKVGAREEVVVDTKKRNPQDFVLWFFLKGRYENHILHWPSPWGEGFPGWHIECSAISRKILGQPFDIHTGGVDHIGTHHTNEIAQSEAAFGVPLANVWMHGEFLLIDAGRMGKSEGNAYNLDSIIEHGFSPLDYRYLCLTAHYRTQLNFTWENLQAAHNTLERLYDFVRNAGAATETGLAEYEKRFSEAVNDDLGLPKAVAIIWEVIASDAPSGQKLTSLLKFDKVLGLGLNEVPKLEVPAAVQTLILEREQARGGKDFARADELRKQIAELGFEIMDSPGGQKIRKL